MGCARLPPHGRKQVSIMINDNLLTRQIEEYITYKQSLGYKILIESQELRRFARYTRDIHYQGSLTSDLSMKWASLNSEYSRFYMSRRLETIHTFAKYITAFDPNAQIPRLGVFGKCHGRVSPHIYTDEEVSLLMKETNKLLSPDGIRSYTVATAIGLLRATGLRPSELTLLTNKNVHLNEGFLFINSSKFKKDRIVPLHPTVVNELEQYQNFIVKRLGQRSLSDYFFVSSYGRVFNTRTFEYAFQQVRLVLQPDKLLDTHSYRLYDFRHTFACETIRNWLQADEDVNQKLYLLSTYMGHSKPEDTYWYLSATPELLAISCNKYELAFGSIFSEKEDVVE